MRSPRALKGPTAVVLAAAILLASPGTGVFAQVARVVTSVSVNPAMSQAGAGAGIAGASVQGGLLSPRGSGNLSLAGILPSAGFSPAVKIQAGRSISGVSRGVAGFGSVAAAEAASAEPRAARKIRGLAPSAAGNSHAKAPAKTALGRLSAAVKDIPRFMGFSGAGLKVEAGRGFDAIAGRNGSSVSPVDSKALFGGAARLSGLRSRSGVVEDSSKTPDIERAAPAAETAAPKQRVSRALRIGALTAVLMLALDMAVMAAATGLGYTFAPSYQMPALADPAAFAALGDFIAPIFAKVQEFLTAAWVAPFNEEVYFRAGVIGFAGWGALKTTRWAAKLIGKIFPKKAEGARKWVLPAAFGLVATEAAMFFALLHEMNDPILITVRIAQALLMSYLYVREGLVSGIAHHAAFNGLAILTLPLVYGAGMTVVLVPQAFAVAAALAAAAYIIWKFTRNAARRESKELAEGTLAPYRLGVKGSRNLARAGWITVGVLAALAFIQPAAGGALMLAALAAQVAPAALAMQAYSFLLRNLERREGRAAVDKIRNPESPLPFGNKVGAWVGGVFGAIYLGLIAAPYMMNLLLSAIPAAALSVPMMSLVGAALPLAGLAAVLLVRARAGQAGISPWLYLSQYFLGTLAAVAAALPWLTSILEKLAGTAASADMGAGMIAPALHQMVWTVPVFIVLAVLMAVIGKKVIPKRKKTGSLPAS